MPRIEVVPSSTAAAPTPGYALVPDTRGTPQGPSQPVAGRKRAARNAGLSAGDTTIRQQNAINKHIADLEKENHRDVQIPVPSKQKDTAGRGSTRKMTPNVRRILVSQKTWSNHLADEEAAIGQTASAAHPPLRRASTAAKEPTTEQSDAAPLDDPLANEPLLKSYVPQAPSPEVMDALTSAPPLSYNASLAVITDARKPQRHFCETCGYWGLIKCMKCGARVCGLECKTTHDEGNCLKFYA